MSKRNVNRKLKKQTEEDFEFLSAFIERPSTSFDTASTSNRFDTSSIVLDVTLNQTGGGVGSEICVSDKTVNTPELWETPSSSSSLECNKPDGINFDKSYIKQSEFDFDTFKNKLSSWAVEESAKQNTLSNLLKVLKNVPTLSNLPSDARTLLHTPRITVVQPFGDGEFIYFGLRAPLKRILSRLEEPLPISIKLLFSIDGLPIAGSSKSVLWPQLCRISSIQDSPVFPVGLFHGLEKPHNANLFMEELVGELKSIIENGLQIDSKIVYINHVGFVCDVPAKAFVLNIKGHAGYSSCTRCDQRGEQKERRVCMSVEKGNARKHEDFLNCTDKSFHNEGGTILVSLPNVDLVKDFSLDYMHMVCLGVVKKIFKLWTAGKKKI